MDILKIFQFFGIFFTLMVGGCTQVKETLGLRKTQPDEFAVAPYQQSLEIPPDFELLPPPGNAQGIAGGIEPFSQKNASQRGPVAHSQGLTPGAASFVQQVGPGLSESGKAQLNQEATTEKNAEKKYLFKNRKSSAGTVINPQEEQKVLSQPQRTDD